HLSLIGEKGNGDWEICCKWDGAYWGAHGPTSSIGGSTRLRVYDATVTPGYSGLPSDRMVPRNTAPAPSVEQDYGDKAEYDDPSGESNEDFEREVPKKKKGKEPTKKPAKKVKVPPKSKKRMAEPQKHKQRKQQKDESDSESDSGSGSESE
ncbi:hypothetical protein DRO61_04765, partial [Candidatus Bathyarchaeota archaeon]